MSEQANPLQEFYAELNRTGVISDKFRAKLMDLANSISEDAFKRGAESIEPTVPEKVYVVAIPWDSRMVHSVSAFSSKKKADLFAKKANKSDVIGYENCVSVDECFVDDEADLTQ